MVIFHGQAEGGMIELAESESLHLNKVLRIQSGTMVWVYDGRGTVYEARVVQSHPKHSILEVVQYEVFTAPKVGVSIAIAPTKQNDRFDWFLEKSVELGARAIYPIRTRNSEKVKFNKERAQRILLAGMKQSKNVFMPELHELQSFEQCMGLGFDMGLAYCGDGDKMSVKAFEEKHREKDILFFIGPEGDFTEEEVTAFLERGGDLVSLGEHRLRTETAAIHVLSWFYGNRENIEKK